MWRQHGPSARPLIRLPSLIRFCFRRLPDFATDALACAPVPFQLSIFLSTYLNRFCVSPFTHTRASPHPERSPGATASCIYRDFYLLPSFWKDRAFFFIPARVAGEGFVHDYRHTPSFISALAPCERRKGDGNLQGIWIERGVIGTLMSKTYFNMLNGE